MMTMNARGSLLKNALELVSEGPLLAEAFMVAMIKSGYTTSRRTFERNLYERIEKRQAQDILSRPDMKRKRQCAYLLISKLKREGFIEKKEGMYSATPYGLEKLKKLNELFVRRKSYEREKDGTLKIIAFDIPEKKKKKRDWLRRILNELGFSMLQKSVWVGRGVLSSDLLNDLKEQGILEHIDIFAVTKTGTIRSLK